MAPSLSSPVKMVLLALPVGLLVGWLILWVWLNSQSMRTQLQDQAARQLGAPLQIESLRFTWSGLRATNIQLAPGGSRHLPAFTASKVDAHLAWSALLRGQIQITSLRITEAVGDFGAPALPEEPSSSGQDTSAAASPRPPRSDGGHPVPAPSKFRPRFALRLQNVTLEKGTLSWPAPRGQRGRWEGFQITADSTGGTDSWRIESTGGTVRHPGFPEAALQRLSAQVLPDQLAVSSAALTVAGGGEITANGSVPWDEGADMTWDIVVRGVPVAGFLPAAWQSHIVGRIESATKLHREHRITTLSGKASLVEGRLISLPLFQKLPLAGFTRAFADLPLSTARTEFRSVEDTLELTNTRLESKGTFRAEGVCTVKQDQLEGSYQLGLKPEWIEFLPGLKETVFTETRDNYRWTPVRVWGPVASPCEDLSGRVADALGQAVPEEAAKTLEKGVRGLRNVLDSFFGK